MSDEKNTIVESSTDGTSVENDPTTIDGLGSDSHRKASVIERITELPLHLKILGLLGSLAIVIAIGVISFSTLGNNDPFSDRNLESLGFVYSASRQHWVISLDGYEEISTCILDKSFDTESLTRTMGQGVISNQITILCQSERDRFTGGTHSTMYLLDSNVNITQVVSSEVYINSLINRNRPHATALNDALNIVIYSFDTGYLRNESIPNDVTMLYFSMFFEFNEFLETSFGLDLSSS